VRRISRRAWRTLGDRVLHKRSALEVVEGGYTSALILHCHSIGLLDTLKKPQSAESLSEQFGYDHEAIEAVLQFLSLTTDILSHTAQNKYRLSPRYHRYGALGFPLEKFLVAYGPALRNLDGVLRRPEKGARIVDRRALAGAFAAADHPLPPALMGVIRASGVRTLLDLACGTASTVRTFCKPDRALRGWGVDSSSHMCSRARAFVRKERLEKQIRIVQSDVRQLVSQLSETERLSVQALFAQSLFNEFSRGETSKAVDFLCQLRLLFPGCPLFVVDYFGVLGRTRRPRSDQFHTLLQDVAQTVSGQGVPPSSHRAWATVYATAGCSMVAAYEGQDSGVRWFMHEVRL
jgi:hypothetical protein